MTPKIVTIGHSSASTSGSSTPCPGACDGRHEIEGPTHVGMRMTCLVVTIFGGMLCLMAAIMGRETPIGVAMVGGGVLGGSFLHVVDLVRHRSDHRRRIGIEIVICCIGLTLLAGGLTGA